MNARDPLDKHADTKTRKANELTSNVLTAADVPVEQKVAQWDLSKKERIS